MQRNNYLNPSNINSNSIFENRDDLVNNLMSKSMKKANSIELSVKVFDPELSELNPILLNYIHQFNKFYLISSNIETFGSDLFNKTNISLANSFQFGDKYLLLLNANYQHLFIKNYSSHSNVSFDLFGQIKIIDDFIFELNINNIFNNLFNNMSSVNDKNDNLERVVSLGANYSFSDNVSYNLAFVFDEKNNFGINSRLYFQLMDVLDFNIRYSNLIPSLGLKLGIKIDNYSIIIGYDYVSQIGYASNIGLSMGF